MKFLVDEQGPGKLERGYDAVHATTLGTGVRIPDDLIAVRSMHQQRIVIILVRF